MIKLIIFDIDGVLTNGNIGIDSLGNTFKTFNFKDFDFIKRLSDLEYKIGFITKEENSNCLKKHLTYNYLYENCKNKLNQLKDILEKENINKNEVIYVGDSLHDVEIIKYIKHGMCPNDAVEEVKNIVYKILSKNGGCGIAEEIYNLLINKII